MTSVAAGSRVVDLREKTHARWPLAQRVKNDAIYGLVRAALFAARNFSDASLRATGEELGAALFWLLPRTRRLSLANAARALGDLDASARRAIVRRAYRELGGRLGEAVAAVVRPDVPAEALPFPDASRELLAGAHAEGRGVLFVSAHLGPWERVATTLVSRGFPLVTIARESYDPRLTKLYDGLRGTRDVKAIYRGAPGSGLAMLRTLRRGGILGAPMDLRSRVPSIDVPFLGVASRTAVGPARLALATGAAVVVGTAAPPLESPIVTTTRIPTADLARGGPEAERALTERINLELSRRIRTMPAAWVWMHPRFLQ